MNLSEMTVYKLDIKGHVIDAPDRLRPLSYSWPEGKTMKEANDLVEAYAGVKTVTKVDYDCVPPIGNVKINTTTISYS